MQAATIERPVRNEPEPAGWARSHRLLATLVVLAVLAVIGVLCVLAVAFVNEGTAALDGLGDPAKYIWRPKFLGG